MVVKNSEGVVSKEELPVFSREQVIRHLLRTLHDGNARAIGSTLEIDAVGHRVVHGWGPAGSIGLSSNDSASCLLGIWRPLRVQRSYRGHKHVPDEFILIPS
jgi:hypothetical protein